MHLLLFIGYSLLCGYGIRKIPFFRKSGIKPLWLLLFFACHVLAGFTHNAIAWRYFPQHGDIWNYFQLSFLYRHRLLHDFNLFLDDNSTWTYFTHNGIVYVQMLLNLFSFDRMDIDTLLFAFPVFLGNIALFRVFRRRFPDDYPAAITVLVLPSVLFWTSCIYREGVLYMLLGFLFYFLDRLFSPERRTRDPHSPQRTPHRRRALLYACCCYLLIAYFRFAIALILIPALFTWWLTEHPLPRRRLWTFTATLTAILITLALTTPALFTPILRAVSTEQESFQILDGHSRLPLPILDPSFASLWRILPVAVRNGLFEPLPGSGGQAIYLAFSLELLLIWSIVILSLIRLFIPKPPTPGPPPRDRNPTPPVPNPASPANPGFTLCCLLFALAGMLLIGMVVPFAGTIVRYRSIYLPFLLAPALHSLRNSPILRSLNRWLTNKLQILI